MNPACGGAFITLDPVVRSRCMSQREFDTPTVRLLRLTSAPSRSRRVARHLAYTAPPRPHSGEVHRTYSEEWSDATPRLGPPVSSRNEFGHKPRRRRNPLPPIPH